VCAAALAAALILGLVPASARDEAGTTLIYPPFGHCLGMHRATTFHLFLYLGTRTEFDEPAGLAAVKLDALDDPSTPSDDDELTVFGLNSGRCEIIYNTPLVNVEIYGECGSGPGQFMNPLGVTANERGHVFVADTGNHRIVHLVYDDGRLEHVGSFGTEGAGEHGLSRPSQVALGESGTLYVADTGNDRVVMASGDGERLGEVTGDPDQGIAFDGPTALAVVEAEDPWIARRQDFIAVVDRGGERLVKISRDGRLLGAVEAQELPVASARFDGLAIDYYGSIYATDRAGGRIHKFDPGLRYVTSVGSPGTGHMELDEPRGITLWRRFGQIFVTERAGAHYFWIGTDILNLEATPGRLRPGEDELKLSYLLTETSRVTVELLDGDGEVVHRLVNHRRRATGENVERWNGMLRRDGGPVPPGSYTLRVEAAPTYSSGEYFQDTAEASL
jgi:hypothetical protein